MNSTNGIHDVDNDTIQMSPESNTISINEKTNSMKPKTPVIVVILLVAIFSGVATGYGIHQLKAKDGGLLTGSGDTGAGNVKEQVPTASIKVGDVYGSANESIFKDSAEGVLQAGALEGEGTHKLVRPGGISQTVYLTSSVTDLDKFVGAKVKVWGETNSAQKAGWLMDVGRVKVLELNAEVPEDSKPTATPTPKTSSKSNSTKTSPTKKPATAEDDSGE